MFLINNNNNNKTMKKNKSKQNKLRPVSFKLGAMDFKINYEHSIVIPEENENLIGTVNVPLGKVHIALNIDGEPVKEDMLEIVTYHEVIHAALDLGGFPDEYKNEALISTLATFLHQFEKTKIYEMVNTENKSDENKTDKGTE